MKIIRLSPRGLARPAPGGLGSCADFTQRFGSTRLRGAFIAFAAFALGVTAAPERARADVPMVIPALGRPVVCLARCHVAKLVDRNRRTGRVVDAIGGMHTTDGHAGVDVAVASLEDADRVFVLAMAPGRVVAVREGMVDRDARTIPLWWLRGREGGNLVVIDHGGGVSSAYAHLARGSVAVRTGDAVSRGQVLGRPGMSGYAAFPHVEIRLFRGGRVVDPVAEGLLTLAQLSGKATGLQHSSQDATLPTAAR